MLVRELIEFLEGFPDSTVEISLDDSHVSLGCKMVGHSGGKVILYCDDNSPSVDATMGFPDW